MKQIRLTDKRDDNTVRFFYTDDGDLCDTLKEAQITDPNPTEVIVHGFYPGSVADWKKWIKGQL